MSPKCETSDAGDSDMLKRSHKVFHVSVKVQVLDSIRKEKKAYAEVAKFDGKNKSSTSDVVTKE